MPFFRISLLSFLFLLLLLPLNQAVPTARQTVIPIPDLEPDEDQPPGPEITPTSTPSVSPIPPPPPVAPAPTVSPISTPSPTPEDDDDDVGAAAPIPPPSSLDGRGSRGANVASGVITLLLFLFAFFAFIALAAATRRSKPAQPDTTVYTSAATRPTPPPLADTTEEGLTEAVYTSKDDARNLGPAAPPPLAPLAEEDQQDRGAPDGGEALGAAAALPRGPTPPPHDYVLGAGPAATRNDFVELRTKFERDEIGDNSAVLGVVGAGDVTEDIGREDIGTRGAGGARIPAAPLPVVAAEEKAEKEGLPDRGGQQVPITFDSQERLMAGGDGSGQISDAAMSLNAGSIAEESGDMPSLERDPIEGRQQRDDGY